MRHATHVLVLGTALALVCCRPEPKPTPPPETPPAQPQPAPKGTSVKVDKNGVEVETRAGDVKLTPDSARIEVPPNK